MGFVEELCDLLLVVDGAVERCSPSLHFARCLFCSEFFMNDLEDGDLLHEAVRGPAIRTVDNFLACGVDTFAQALTRDVFQIGASKGFEEASSV